MKKYNCCLFLFYVMLSFSSMAGYSQQLENYKPKLLRFDEDYSTLADSLKKKYPLLRFKNIAVNDSGRIHLSFGLDYREMYELVKGYDSAGVKDGYWLTRFMAHTDVQFGKKFRAFFQIGRTFIAGRQLPIRQVDVDELFFLNAFGEYRFGKTNTNYVRAGRQELFFGMGRLIAPREGPNVRNTYDAVRVHYNAGAFSLDGFFSYLVDNRSGILDNKVLGNNQRLWGLYSSRKAKTINADFYYLGYYNPLAQYSKQVQRDKETRHSIGTRLYGKIVKSTTYDAELVYQFGKFGNNTIAAFLADGKITGSYKWGKSTLSTSVKGTWSTGNRSVTDNKLNTFNPLFPNLLYYQTAIGIFPANLFNPQLAEEWRYKKLVVAGGVDLFWRVSAADGLYAPFGNLPLRNGFGKYLGYQLYCKADYNFSQNLACGLLVSRYYKSSLIKQNNEGRGVDLLLNILLNYKL